MGGQKKPPLYKSFGYAFEGIFCRDQKREEHEDTLLHDGPGHCRGTVFFRYRQQSGVSVLCSLA